MLAACRCGQRIGQCEGGFADSGGADQQSVGSSFKTAAEKFVQLRVSARSQIIGKRLVVLGGDEAREDFKTALSMMKSW